MYRVILVPGPQEIEVVQKVYTRFVADKQTEREIAEQLNGAGMPSSSCFSSRFGSLVRAYTLIGWEPDRTSPTSRLIGACGGAMPTGFLQSSMSCSHLGRPSASTPKLTS